jgi:hypothetical protein
VTDRWRVATAAMLALFAAVALWNAARYPPGLGYDAADHIAYAELLVEDGRLPEAQGEYYTPPLFYALAGSATKLGEGAGLDDPRRAAQAVNALLALGTALLVVILARLLWADRPLLHVAALGFFAFGALVLKTAAMFHPETLSLFLSTLALVLAARMIVRRSFGAAPAVALGAVLGLGQLVRAWSLWTFAVVLLMLAAVALADRVHRRRVAVASAWAVAATLVVTAPWYVHQAVRYSNPVFDRPTVAKPLWERRPASFYVDPGLPEVVTRPYRPSFTNRFWPEIYAEAWGDWFGVFAWNSSDGPPSRGERRELVAQSAVGILPTALAVAGVALVLAAARRRPELLLVGLLPLAGLAGLLYFAVSYPTPDGDVIKATYMLTTAPAWALAFGVAVERTAAGSRALGFVLALVLAVSAVISVKFAAYGLP